MNHRSTSGQGIACPTRNWGRKQCREHQDTGPHAVDYAAQIMKKSRKLNRSIRRD
jgi:hypothetical protein